MQLGPLQEGFVYISALSCQIALYKVTSTPPWEQHIAIYFDQTIIKCIREHVGYKKIQLSRMNGGECTSYCQQEWRLCRANKKPWDYLYTCMHKEAYLLKEIGMFFGNIYGIISTLGACTKYICNCRLTKWMVYMELT